MYTQIRIVSNKNVQLICNLLEKDRRKRKMGETLF